MAVPLWCVYNGTDQVFVLLMSSGEAGYAVARDNAEVRCAAVVVVYASGLGICVLARFSPMTFGPRLQMALVLNVRRPSVPLRLSSTRYYTTTSPSVPASALDHLRPSVHLAPASACIVAPFCSCGELEETGKHVQPPAQSTSHIAHLYHRTTSAIPRRTCTFFNSCKVRLVR